MNKRFLKRLIKICLGLGIAFIFFGTAVLVVCGVILLALVAFVLIPRCQNAPMPRDTRVDKAVYQAGVERRRHLELKDFVWPNWFKRKRDSSCPAI